MARTEKGTFATKEVSPKLRDEILAAYEAGASQRTLAEKFKLGRPIIRRVLSAAVEIRDRATANGVRGDRQSAAVTDEMRAARKEKYRETARRWVKNNPDKCAEKQARHLAKPEVQAKRAAARYFYHRRPDVVENRNKWVRDKWTNDPQFKIASNMRRRISKVLNAVKAGKSAGTVELLGMPVSQWLALQSPEMIEAMMNGEDVHVDEIRPCASFDLTDPEQQACCFNWRNRQLLLADDNRSKSAKFTAEDRAEWEAMMIAKGWTGKLF